MTENQIEMDKTAFSFISGSLDSVCPNEDVLFKVDLELSLPEAMSSDIILRYPRRLINNTAKGKRIKKDDISWMRKKKKKIARKMPIWSPGPPLFSFSFQMDFLFLD